MGKIFFPPVFFLLLQNRNNAETYIICRYLQFYSGIRGKNR